MVGLAGALVPNLIVDVLASLLESVAAILEGKAVLRAAVPVCGH